MKDIVHENLNVFAGACVEPPNLCLLWHYCSKGSLNVSTLAVFLIILLKFIADIRISMLFVGEAHQ